jgi:ribosome-associated translation inhibitor RaiA
MEEDARIEISNIGIPERLEIEEDVKKFLDKFQKRWKISKLKIDVDVHSPGGRLKYSMHAKAIASDILFISDASGWDVPSTLKLLFEKLSKKIGKELKRKKEHKNFSKPFFSSYST